MSKEPQAEQFRRLSLQDLQQMYRAGQARPAVAETQFPGACYLCGNQYPTREGQIWKVRGSIQGTRVLCSSCDTQVQTVAAEGE